MRGESTRSGRAKVASLKHPWRTPPRHMLPTSQKALSLAFGGGARPKRTCASDPPLFKKRDHCPRKCPELAITSCDCGGVLWMRDASCRWRTNSAGITNRGAKVEPPRRWNECDLSANRDPKAENANLDFPPKGVRPSRAAGVAPGCPRTRRRSRSTDDALKTRPSPSPCPSRPRSPEAPSAHARPTTEPSAQEPPPLRHPPLAVPR